MPLTLRPYQRDAIDAVHAAYAAGTQRPALVLPTGAGKTVTVAATLGELFVPGERALFIAHRRELIDQNAKELRGHLPHLRVGELIGSNRRGLAGADIVSASIQTLKNDPSLVSGVRTVVIDECHHATASSYRLVLDAYGCFSSGGARALGVTATMSRSDKAGLGDIWQDIVHTVPISQLIADGYLVRPFGKRITVKDLDLSAVRRQAGELQEKALGQALHDAGAPDAIAHAYREHASDRQGIVFVPTVAIAHEVTQAMNLAGFTAASIWGAMADVDRAAALAAYRRGDVQILVNCMVLTEGTNLPMTSCIVVARATTNAGLYVQMAGRGLRLHPESGKTDCLILDIAGVTKNLRLASPIDLYTTEELAKERPDGLEDWAEEIEEAEEVIEIAPAPEVGPRAALVLRDWAGKLDVEEVDLFGLDAKTGAAWELTRGGVWFLPVGTDEYIAVLKAALPIPGLYDIVRCHKRERGNSVWVATSVSGLANARLTAENSLGVGDRAATRGALRSRSWAASGKQAGLAASLGIPVVPGMTSGEVSRMIDIELASRRLDEAIPEYARR